MYAFAYGFVHENHVWLGEFSVYWYDQLHLKVLELLLKSENFSILSLNNWVPLHFNLILNESDFFQHWGSQLFYL